MGLSDARGEYYLVLSGRIDKGMIYLLSKTGAPRIFHSISLRNTVLGLSIGQGRIADVLPRISGSIRLGSIPA